MNFLNQLMMYIVFSLTLQNDTILSRDYGRLTVSSELSYTVIAVHTQMSRFLVLLVSWLAFISCIWKPCIPFFLLYTSWYHLSSTLFSLVSSICVIVVYDQSSLSQCYLYNTCWKHPTILFLTTILNGFNLNSSMSYCPVGNMLYDPCVCRGPNAP